MPGNLPVPRGVELKMLWHLAGSPAALTIMHLDNVSSTPIDQALATTVDSTVKAAFTSSTLSTFIHSTVSLRSVSLRDMSDLTRPEFVGTGATVPGSDATADMLPPNVSLVVTHRTALRGASFRGRSYVWGWTSATLTPDGNADPINAQAASDFFGAIRSNLSNLPNPLNFSILSRFSSTPPLAPNTERNPPILTPVTVSVLRDMTWDTQRRRAIPGI